MRRVFAALAVLLASAVLAGFAPPAVAAPVTYVAPVSGTVVDGFRPPTTPYGRGNRGLTYVTSPGSPVIASAPGRVTFAGQVGGALHVVVQHADGVRTSYSFLRDVRVRVGQTVKQSDTVGTTNSSMHFGARIGDAYIDPAILLASGPSHVHLVPDGEFTEKGAAKDRFALLQIVHDFPSITAGAFRWLKDRGGELADAGALVARGVDRLGRRAFELARGASGATRRTLLRIGRELVAVAEDVTAAAADHLIGLLDQIVNMGEWAGPFAALAAALADIIEAWVHPCTPADVEPPPMVAPQERIGVFIAGLGSHSSGPHAKENMSSELGAMALGYSLPNIYDFSYRGGHPPLPYEAGDTTGDLRDDARNLRGLLDQIAREHPGVPVDLIAHSQGGLIAREAMAHDYDGPEHQLPAIDHVITLATPHHGADAATAAAWLRWSLEGQAIRRLAKEKFTPFDMTGPGVAQLSETSDFIDRLNHRALREGIAYTSIASATDLTVPAVRTRVADATNVIVDADPGKYLVGSHSGIKQSPSAFREVQLALADAPPTCQPVWKTATRAFSGAELDTDEDLAGAAVAAKSVAP